VDRAKPECAGQLPTTCPTVRSAPLAITCFFSKGQLRTAQLRSIEGVNLTSRSWSAGTASLKANSKSQEREFSDNMSYSSPSRFCADVGFSGMGDGWYCCMTLPEAMS